MTDTFENIADYIKITPLKAWQAEDGTIFPSYEECMAYSCMKLIKEKVEKVGTILTDREKATLINALCTDIDLLNLLRTYQVHSITKGETKEDTEWDTTYLRALGKEE